MAKASRRQYVLDLDLDIFVDPVVCGTVDNDYRADDSHVVEPHEAVMSFFERLQLSPGQPTPGAFFDHHRDSYYHWRNLIRSGDLRTPFVVIHIDAHSDLGNGACAHRLLETWAAVADKNEQDPPVNSANYLAFALANGWVSSLLNVRRDNSPDDVPVFLFENFDPRCKRMTAKRFAAGEVARTCFAGYEGADYEVIAETEYLTCRWTNLPKLPGPFDFAFIARSPSFTPAAIDKFEPFARDCLSQLP